MSGLLAELDGAVRSMTEGRDVAVAFSGGLDSGIIAVLTKRYARSVRLYTVGTEDSYDVQASRDMCQQLGMEWEFIEMDEDSLIEGLRESVKITGTTDPVVLSFEVPLMYILPRAKERYVIGGQGADETFLGYSKYLDLSDGELKKAAEEDFQKLRDITLVHESKMAGRYGKEILYPYLSEGVRKAASAIDLDSLRPVGDDRKRPLKDIAMELGHPEIAAKTKKAAQYGTGSMNMIKRLAKRNGQSVSEFIFSLKEGQ